MAARSHISRKAKRQETKKSQIQTELFYYHKMISNFMSEKVLDAFKWVKNVRDDQKQQQK
jgi:hypothetical protein